MLQNSIILSILWMEIHLPFNLGDAKKKSFYPLPWYLLPKGLKGFII